MCTCLMDNDLDPVAQSVHDDLECPDGTFRPRTLVIMLGFILLLNVLAPYLH